MILLLCRYVHEFLPLLVIPFCGWIIFAERKMSRMEGKLDIIILTLNGKKKITLP